MLMKKPPLLAVLGVLALAGCSRTPDGVIPDDGTLVTIEIKMTGVVHPANYYYAVIDTDNNPGTGPIPVASRPWGNGYAAGSYTHYVLLHGGVFGVYESVDPSHSISTYLGRPIQAAVTTTSKPNDTIVVQLDTTQLKTVNPGVRALDVNLIATDRVPLDPQDPTPKIVDGLGRGGNDYVTIPVTYTSAYANGVDPDPTHPERAEPDIVPDPNCDILDWKITVMTGQ
ncbi:MAG TPA: hypothetical protein PKK84_02715 [Armatimonadota bacterium]|jgi:hypothetical protein|nr:hypothetical protein [Armatimonadota bacterium]